MKVVVLQPSYLPWRGYFHLIQKADLFVFYDDVQYDARGWRNRNRFKTAGGTKWLTVPVHSADAQAEHRPITSIEIDWSTQWTRKHQATILQAYAKAPHFDRYRPLLDGIFSRRDRFLADLTIDTTVNLSRELGLATRFLRSSSLGADGNRTDRLLEVLRKVGATSYLSGPSARSYLDEAKLAAAGIALEYIAYDYPPYPQLHGIFEPFVSIIDLLMMTGPEAPCWIWGAVQPSINPQAQPGEERS